MRIECIDNTDYEASLEVGKFYAVVPDPAGESHHLVRVVDESGEDYLLPDRLFRIPKL